MVGRRHDVSLAPADELFADVERELPVLEGSAQTANGPDGDCKPILEVRTPDPFDLIVRIAPDSRPAANWIQPAGLTNTSVAGRRVHDRGDPILRRVLWKDGDACLQRSRGGSPPAPTFQSAPNGTMKEGAEARRPGHQACVTAGVSPGA